MTTRSEYGRFDGETPIYCGMCGYDGVNGWVVDNQGISCPICKALIIAIGNQSPVGLTAAAAELIDKLFRDLPKRADNQS